VDILDPKRNKILTVRKSFQLRDATKERDKGMGYEFDLTYELFNLSGRPLHIKLAFNGTNTPEIDSQNTRDLAELFTGYDDNPKVWTDAPGDPQAILSVKDRNEIDLRESKGRPMLWTAQRSNYFAAIVRPTDPGASTTHFAKIFAQSQAAEPKSTGDDPVKKEVAVGYDTTGLPLEAGAKPLTLGLKVYFGPTARKILDTDYYSGYPRGYNAILVVTGGPCGYCTYAWLINLLVGALNGFYFLFRDWGLAIIALVLVVRLLLHPITKKSQVSMTKMSKMAPEMERLKKKYGDDKEGLNKAMMTFYREQGITPILGCLPMFLQMPIWIALWSALQSTFEIRQAPFLWGYTWIHDLSLPDAAIPFSGGGLSLGFFTLKAINVLPILMAVVFYFQQKMQPKPDPKTLTPEQAQQQKMMQWMSLLFPIFLYTSPSGLNLYILTSTAIGIYESKRIRDHIKEREAAEKEGKAPPGKGGVGGGIMGWIVGKFADLQSRAEAARGNNSGRVPAKRRK
jgi:YidC/Oxa1 family membrane protein insertase